jgi:Cu+-exporting ATPase
MKARWAGATVQMGSLRWMQELGLDLGPLASVIDDLQQQGATVSVWHNALADGRCRHRWP